MMSVVPRTGRKSTELVALALPLAMTVMGIVVPARAGCDADRDCKGDRICVDERCVDPDADDRAAAPAISAKAVKRAETRLARARGFAVAGWIVGGLGVVGGGITIAAAIEDDWYSGPIGVSALVATAMFGAGIPLASAGGANARAGLDELRIDTLSPAARITGWVFYGVCLTTGIAAGALTFAEVDYVGYGLGGAAIATGIAGLTLMSIDGHVHAAMLAAALDELAVDTTHPTRREPLVLLSPWFNLPDHDGGPVRAGIGITGRW